MNNDKYEAILKQADKADEEEKMNCVLTMLSMIGTNHLPCIDKKIKKIYKAVLIVGIAILLAILFQDQVSFTEIVSLIGRVGKIL